MDSYFMDNINLPNSHPSVFGSLLHVLSQKSGFLPTWSDYFEISIKNQKKFKDRDSHRKDFLRDSAPQNPKFHRLDQFFIFFNFFSYSQKNSKKFALVLFDF